MRILDRYLFRSLLATWMAVLSVLLLVAFGSEATRLLAVAVEGDIPPGLVLSLLIYKIPPALEIILPLVALLSVMLAMGRLYQDQEMVVLQSCGVSLRWFQKRLLVFLLPLVALTAWVSGWVAPWSHQQSRVLMDQAQSMSPVTALTPGRFNELPAKQGVFYTRTLTDQSEMTDVWIRLAPTRSRGETILMAPQGQFETIDERLALVLFDGAIYESVNRPEDFSVREFERFEGFLPSFQARRSAPGEEEMSNQALMGSNDPAHQAQWQWRLSAPVSVLIMGLLGLKLSRTGPRQGRFAKIALALVLYVTYYQLLISLRSMMGEGEWPLVVGLWPVWIVFLIYALTLDGWRRGVNKPRARRMHEPN
ncbi:LPS export ABC transporter permease LptF [Thiomicrospira sp. WB1]|uniref:LPS export ABC transporter permease LptF n=1 Tax=Thiomicrospira sp. WB1 TaxID=1685380 RepID=UPI0007465E82|nr:LPS export ABC transporter permease LptF [Thiomicrospira sp. WB1]KUJ72191.1 LPS export ABC transporter permease LptF [Thiomicrospira sp. WB1]